jgi:hypothetical protein
MYLKKISIADSKTRDVDGWRAIFEYHYLPVIQQQNLVLNSLIKLIKLCQHENIKTHLYFLPINYYFGKYLFGENFITWIDSNKQIVKDALNEKLLLNIDDFSYLFDSSRFFRREEPTEHLNEQGRLELSSKLTNLVN